MASMPEFALKARSDSIERMVQECAAGRLSFSGLCEQISEMGFRTTSLYEMVRAAEADLGTKRDTAHRARKENQ